jgi:signal transduction histidine kinase
VVKGDRVQLTELFENLIANAMKFRSSKTPLIHIGVEGDSQRWRFSIRDNGIGMEPRFAKRIFQPFRRLHTREEYAGSGMGLAICRRIVERHGGTIWTEAEPRAGATFYFTLSRELNTPVIHLP